MDKKKSVINSHLFENFDFAPYRWQKRKQNLIPKNYGKQHLQPKLKQKRKFYYHEKIYFYLSCTYCA